MAERRGMAVILYARASSQRQAEKGLSVPAQLRELRRYCKQHGLRIVKEFVDDGYSGTSDRRPGFQRMMHYAMEHHDEVDKILVWSFSRFSRNRFDAVMYKLDLRRWGIRVESISEPITEGVDGELTEAILEAINAHRSRTIARDVIRGMRETVLQGYYPLTNAPIGYRREEVQVGGARRFQLVPDEAWALVVRWIFHAYVNEGKGAKEIARELNEKGIIPPTSRWDRNKILRMLSNPIYIGTLVVRFDTETALLLPPEQREVVKEDFCQPLVDRGIFERAQQVREQRAREHPCHLTSNYLLSGLAFCATCGAKLIGVPAKGGRYHYYACATYWNSGREACDGGLINQGLLDGIVLERVRNVLLCDENIRQLATETGRVLREEVQRTEEERRVLHRQLEDRERALERLLDLVETGREVPQTIWQRIQGRERDVEEIRNKLAALDARIGAVRAVSIDVGEVVRYVTFLRWNLEYAPVREQRDILRGFIRRIEVGKDEVEIEYRLPRPKTAQRSLEDVSSVDPSGTPGRI